MRYVNVPLYPDAYYSYAISLERVSYVIKIKYVERTQSWYMDLLTRDNIPVFMGIKLVPNYPITFDYVSPLSGFFWLSPKPDVDPEKATLYPEDLHTYYDLLYIRDDAT